MKHEGRHSDLNPYLTTTEYELEHAQEAFGTDLKEVHTGLTERVQGRVEERYGRLKPASFPWLKVGGGLALVAIAVVTWWFWPEDSQEAKASIDEPAKKEQLASIPVRVQEQPASVLVDSISEQVVEGTVVEEGSELETDMEEAAAATLPVKLKKDSSKVLANPFENGVGSGNSSGPGEGGEGANPTPKKPELVLMAPVANCVVTSQDSKAQVDWQKMPHFGSSHKDLERHITASIKGQRVREDDRYDRAVRVEFKVNNNGKPYDWVIHGKPYPFVEKQIKAMIDNFPKFERGSVSGKKGRLNVIADIVYDD